MQNDLFEFDSAVYYNCTLKRDYGKFKKGQEFVKIKIEYGRKIELRTEYETYISVISEVPQLASHICPSN